MYKTKRESRLITCYLLSLCLLVALTGCSKNEPLMPKTELLDIEKVEMETKPDESDALVENPELIKYDNYIEAYLDILTKNRSILTDEQLSEAQINASSLDIGEGKIVVLDVLGDKTPELLYIYTDPEVTEFTNRLFLKIFTFSIEEGIKPVFDSRVYSASGGGSTYCVFLTNDGDLMGYYFASSAYEWYGFWPILSQKELVCSEYEDPLLYIDNCDLARLFYIDSWTEIEVPYMQYGEEITEEQFNKIGKEIIGDISQVLFQGTVTPEHGLKLYKYLDFWKGITPLDESCMTYDEAVEWLKTIKE